MTDLEDSLAPSSSPLGAIFTSSFAGVSTAQIAAATDSPALAAQQWVHVHQRCHKLCTPLVLFSAACFGSLKFATHSTSFLAAATACMGIVPFTVAFLKSSERILRAVASSEHQPSSDHTAEQVRGALARWGALNMIRTLFPLVGGLLALSMCY
ncbi:DUF1772 domain-containing protein [Aspergillus aculeatinus CBS 121060]|uniref:Uncharacterized protein n=1 Tax=Aspergillus aculeatinus CBS 121060 TaxID=1448322 RepID=A0ACD1HI08_9EURO|nr:hypothetical protein BO66DRAFT_238757 [Aspergillus aculeatinus CBS 121060]RAH73278.1 hypothetical protein BO66DRAFT_238757 [Aspergillus aculeatinus CBS 121060]